MNHSADIGVTGTRTGSTALPTRSGGAALTALALLLYAAILFGAMRSGASDWAIVLSAPVAYLLAMYLYYGIPRLAFERRFAWIWLPAIAAIALSYLLVGATQIWSVVTGWALLLFPAIIAGRLTDGGTRPRTVYLIALGTLWIAAVAQIAPHFAEIMKGRVEIIGAAVTKMQENLDLLGVSAEQGRLMIEMFRRMLTVIYRLWPAEMLLGAAAQFSVGYLLFARWVDRRQAARTQLEPFIYWKMPYGFTAAVIVFAIVRLLGNETLAIIADNGLAMLAVFYTVTGLALIEWFLRKIQFSRLMKVLFYVFMILLPLVSMTLGLAAGAAVFLLGFADSFADWRRIRLREYV